MDLIGADKRQSTFDQRAAEVRQKCASAGWTDNVRIFATSIWDETLYSVSKASLPCRITEENKFRQAAKNAELW